MAVKVALTNMKGGVGKSTLAVNLAWGVASRPRVVRRVLVVDIDPQFNASQYLLGARRYQQTVVESDAPTVWDIFEQNTRVPGRARRRVDPTTAIRSVVNYSDGSCVHLIPSRLELAFSLKHPGRKDALLARAIGEVEAFYDLILFDCPPTESILTDAAYLASNQLLIPVKPEFLSSIGLGLLDTSIREFRREHRGKRLTVAGIVFNHLNPDTSGETRVAKSQVRALAMRRKWNVFKAEIPYSRSFPKGAREGKPLFRTSYSRYEMAQRVSAFVSEFCGRVGI
jgi:chromosome partitioning protein